ncbi:MAG: hypothetical protein U0836_15235 [Pirellulales bacterium]
MLLAETAIFYLLFGAGVAAAAFVRGRREGRVVQTAEAALACLFWPLVVPLLLGGAANDPLGDEDALAERAPDELAAAIAQVERELDEALAGLAGWAEDVLAGEQPRLDELRTAWKLQAERIRELDRLLAAPAAAAEPWALATGDDARARHCEELRRQNLDQLRELRGRLRSDLVGTLAWVRELVTMIHLARFSGAPAGRVEELVAQIAAAVEGLSEVSAWRETAGT